MTSISFEHEAIPRGKHSPKGRIAIPEDEEVSRPLETRSQNDTRTTRNHRPVFFLAFSYLPWVALSLVVSTAAIIILNSGFSAREISHLFTPTIQAIGGFFS